VKVFLGGTCNGSRWREDLIPKLTIDYFNPVLEEWSETAYHDEVAAKLDCNYFLYCLTPKYTGYFSFAEVVNESFHYKNQTIFCFTPEDDGQKFTETEIESLKDLGDKVVENGGLWLENLEEVGNFLNSTQENRVELNKYDFFISYGRKHSSSLASKMNHSFIKEGKSVWMDKFCIPLGVDFQKSIEDGIAKSDNFVYIISPHSVQSEYCTNELEVALKYGKRIIPVLHILDPGMEEFMHPEIQKLNWIYFDAERKFQHGLSELLILGSTDQGHLENNTRWLQKAVEWDSNKRNKDFLLSETETILAEDWYNDALEKKKSPPPSALNGIFINESAKAVLLTKRRKRRAALLVRLLSVFMFIALIFSIYYWRESISAEGKAIEQQGIAEGATKEAIRLQEIAILEKTRADSLRIEAVHERLVAEIAKDDAIIAEEKAIKQQRIAEDATDKMEVAKIDALNQKGKADSSATVAQINEQKASKLLLQSLAKSLFKQAKDLKERNPKLSEKAILLAYELNAKYLDNSLNKDAYLALFDADTTAHKFKNKDMPSKAVNIIESIDDYLVVGDLSGEVNIYKGNKLIGQDTTAIDTIVAIEVFKYKTVNYVSIASKNEVKLFELKPDKLLFKTARKFPTNPIETIYFDNKSRFYVCTDKKIYGYSPTLSLSDSLLVQGGQGNTRIVGNGDNVVVIFGKTILNKSTRKTIDSDYNISSVCPINSNYAVLGDERGYLIGLKLSDLSTQNFGANFKHKFEVSTIAYSKKHDLLYSGSIDKTVRIWSLKDSANSTADIIEYEGYKSWVRSIALDTSENWLVLGGDAKKVEYIPANYKFLHDKLKSKTTNPLDSLELMQLTQMGPIKLTQLRVSADSVDNE
jgi:hypothetical protein